MNLNIDTMTLDELRQVIKMMVENSNNEHNRITALQERVLALEMKSHENN